MRNPGNSSTNLITKWSTNRIMKRRHKASSHARFARIYEKVFVCHHKTINRVQLSNGKGECWLLGKHKTAGARVRAGHIRRRFCTWTESGKFREKLRNVLGEH